MSIKCVKFGELKVIYSTNHQICVDRDLLNEDHLVIFI